MRQIEVQEPNRAVQPTGQKSQSWLELKIAQSQVLGIFIVLVILCTVLCITCPTTFPTPDNLWMVARQFSYIVVVAIGELMVILTGGLDFSVGTMMGLGALTAGLFMKSSSIPSAILIGIICGGVLGFCNSLFVAKLGVSPFLITSGTSSIGRGLMYTVTGGYAVTVPPAFSSLGQGYWGAIPYPVIYMGLIWMIFEIFLRRTVFGRRIYAVGGNEEAAKVSGINVSRIKMFVYTFSGILAAVGGIICSARLGVVTSNLFMGYEMYVLGAVFIGGAGAGGGTGSVTGTILGAAIMGVLQNGLILLSVGPSSILIVIGSIIIIGGVLDRLKLK
jgi:ribose transport system permease protein